MDGSTTTSHLKQIHKGMAAPKNQCLLRSHKANPLLEEKNETDKKTLCFLTRIPHYSPIYI